MGAEGRALARSFAGTGVAPIYQRTSAAAKSGSRRPTPPIALEVSINETYAALIARQGRSDNQGLPNVLT